jgi:membrane protein
MKLFAADGRRGRTRSRAREWVGFTKSRSIAQKPAGPPLWATGLGLALMALGFGSRDPAQAQRRRALRDTAGRRQPRERSDRKLRREVHDQSEPRARDDRERGDARGKSTRQGSGFARDSRDSHGSTSRRGTDALRVAAQPGRGRDADAPSEIPARGWKDILWRIYQNIGEHRVIAIAAGVTFYVLLAIFPAIAALVSVYGLFADAASINSHLTSMASVLPGGAVDIIGEQITRLTAQPAAKLGLTFFFGLAISLWSANAGIKALFDALNIVYGEKEKRGFFKLNLVSLTFTAGVLVFALIAIAAVVVLPIALDYVGLGRATELLVRIGRWPVMFLVVALGIALIYRYGASRDTPRWRWITWGSAFAAVTWIVASILFSWYASKFGSYNKTYGSLGAAIGFMTWIWLSTIVVLMGAELDAEMEHQTARDTTEGPPQPIGARGAAVADTVGAAHG